jgi:hypothetical protein
VRGNLVDRSLEDGHGWPQELVDRRADDNDQLVRPANHLRASTEFEPSGWEDVREEPVGTVLEKWHLAAADPVERQLVRVIDPDMKAGIGQREAQGKADMAAAAKDDDVKITECHRGPH